MPTSPPGPGTTLLVADIGGTNARFGLYGDSGLRRTRVLACADFAGPVAAAEAYLDAIGGPRPRAAAFAVATPVGGDRVSMTNRAWSFSIAGTQRALGLRRLAVVNDFAALALAIPRLSRRWTPTLKPGRARSAAPIAVLGPGTGLGTATLLPGADGPPTRRGWTVIPGEGGHRDIAPASEREWRVITFLHGVYGHVSAERLLSGPGLVNIHGALAAIDSRAPPALDAAAITAGAGRDRHCREATTMFAGLLGAVAGDLALTLGALGGVYIGGGMVPRMGAAFDAAVFRARFLAKGRFAAYLRPVPVRLVTHPMAALIGAAGALESMTETPPPRPRKARARHRRGRD